VRETMKLSNLIGKKVRILECKKDWVYYYEFENEVRYDKTHWDKEDKEYVGVVVDVGTGRNVSITVKSGGFLWDFDDTELAYREKVIDEVVTEWDFENCKSLVKKDDEWGIDIGGE